MTADLTFLDAAGQPVVEVASVRLRRAPKAALGAAIAAQATRVERWLHEVAWREAPLPAAQGLAAGKWLILAPPGELGPALVRRIESAGAQAALLPAQGDAAACRAALEAHAPFVGVVHAVTAGRVQGPPASAGALLDAQSSGAGSLLHLIQALGRLGSTAEVLLVTRGAAYGLRGDAVAGLTHSPLIGLGRAVAVELSGQWCGALDLDPAGEPADAEAAAIVAELSARARETGIARRAGRRHVARLAPAAHAGGRRLELRSDGTFLVTGGLGDLGLAVARRLVERGARSLVLVGRSAPSPKAADAIRGLEAAGARVSVEQGDVAVESNIQRIIQKVQATMPPLRGVIHAAGVLADAVLANQTWPRFAQVMAPKLEGAWNLHLHTAGLSLDFFVLFGSAAGLLGSPGQSNYAAANAFLDALAHHRRASGLPALSVDWGPWAEVGMAARAAGPEGVRARELLPIPPEQGLDILERLITGKTGPQIGAVAFDWERLAAIAPGDGLPPFLGDARRAALDASRSDRPGAAGGKSAPKHRELESLVGGAPPEKRWEVLSGYVREQLASVLGLDPTRPIEPRRGFFDLGMDSLMALDLNRRLEAALGRRLPATLVLEYPTLDALSSWLGTEALSLAAAQPAEPDAATRAAEAAAEMRSRIESLSDEEAEAALLEKLAGIGTKASL